jgi:DnaK suppressor protein
MSRSTIPVTSGRRPAPPYAEHLEVLRAMLEQQREFRVTQLTELHLPDPRSPLSSPDPEIFRSLVSGARAALREVQSALWRMDEGRYGRCVDCDEPVGLARLEILPQTARCMRCQRSAAGQ